MTEAAQKIEAREPGFEWIPPDKLSPSKTNPRKRFDGPEMDELTASVKVHGVLQPLVVRPNGEGFEIVAGERRFRAAKAAGLEVVPCMVRALTDEDVLEIQIIENLQRQDLNPLEEARGFKVILDQGRLEVADLAEKINVSAQYIGRRVAVLELPEVMLKAWGKGEFQFGHLVQLARVRDDKTRNELAKEVLRYGQSVGDLRRRVAALSPHLDKAPFKTAECNTCSANSQVQKTLLAPEDLAEQQKGRHCLNPKCYRKKLLAWIKENENKLIGRSGARSVRLDEGFSWENKHAFHRAESAPKACRECDKLVILVDLYGQRQAAYYGKSFSLYCIGDQECHAKHDRAPRPAGGGDGDSGGARGNRRLNAGLLELERICREAVARRVVEASPEIKLRLAVAALASAWPTEHRSRVDGHEVVQEFVQALGASKDDDLRYYRDKVYYPVIEAGEDAFQEAWTRMMAPVVSEVEPSYGQPRRLSLLYFVARTLDIDPAQVWTINEDYLKKFTKDDLVALGNEIGLWESQDFQVWQTEQKLPDQTKMKKGDLIKAFLESRFDLAGKVPREMVEAFREQPAEEAA